MWKKVWAAALGVGLVVGFGGMAFAGECEGLYVDFLADLGRSAKPDDIKAKARALAEEGMRDHRAGNHDDAERKLRDAQAMVR